MTSSEENYEELREWLRGEGHSPMAINKILAKLEEYDAKTMHESVFDSINSGKFDIASIIQEALGDDTEQA